MTDTVDEIPSNTAVEAQTAVVEADVGDVSGESAGAVETRGARLVRELRQCPPGPLGLAPAAPCGGRPRQLDAALAQERTALRLALANAVDCVDQAREDLMKWLNRRSSVYHSRPSINEIKEIGESGDHVADGSASDERCRRRASVATLIHSKEKPGDQETTASNSDEDELSTTSLEELVALQKINTENNEMSEDNNNIEDKYTSLVGISTVTTKNNSKLRQKCHSASYRPHTTSGACRNSILNKLTKKTISNFPVKKPEVVAQGHVLKNPEWEKTSPHLKHSTKTLCNELSLYELSSRFQPTSMGYGKSYLRKKSLDEIYGGASKCNSSKRYSSRMKSQRPPDNETKYCESASSTVRRYSRTREATKMTSSPLKQTVQTPRISGGKIYVGKEDFQNSRGHTTERRTPRGNFNKYTRR